MEKPCSLLCTIFCLYFPSPPLQTQTGNKNLKQKFKSKTQYLKPKNQLRTCKVANFCKLKQKASTSNMHMC
jgi:hypothetical protein